MTPEQNPYAAPTTEVYLLSQEQEVGTEAEEIRRKYLKHEVSVQSIGLLYYLGGGVLALAAIGFIIGILATMRPKAPVDDSGIPMVVLVAVYVPLAAASIAIGRGLRKLRGWVRVPVGILSAIGLIGFPIGTIINAYILYLIFCEKGTMVFSPQYAEVIRQTPHIKYRTALWLWILLAVLIAVVIVGLVAALMK